MDKELLGNSFSLFGPTRIKWKTDFSKNVAPKRREHFSIKKYFWHWHIRRFYIDLLLDNLSLPNALAYFSLINMFYGKCWVQSDFFQCDQKICATVSFSGRSSINLSTVPVHLTSNQVGNSDRLWISLSLSLSLTLYRNNLVFMPIRFEACFIWPNGTCEEKNLSITSHSSPQCFLCVCASVGECVCVSEYMCAHGCVWLSTY